jgi:hypothetical protein
MYVVFSFHFFCRPLMGFRGSPGWPGPKGADTLFEMEWAPSRKVDVASAMNKANAAGGVWANPKWAVAAYSQKKVRTYFFKFFIAMPLVAGCIGLPSLLCVHCLLFFW